MAETDGTKDLVIGSLNGMAIRFAEADARPMGRSAYGVRGMQLGKAARGGGERDRPHYPELDAMGPGVESVPDTGNDDEPVSPGGPRSTMGRGGMRGGWKAKKFRKK